MIDYTILDEEGIVILEPSGALQKSDFEKLAKDIDAHIEKHGDVNGLIIRAKEFPGWENFGAFSSHLSFVKEHHKKIRRVAIVTDSTLMTVIPNLAKHFVSAEVKHFDYDDMEAAQSWVSEIVPSHTHCS